ncbi:MAG: TonB-dependent receptor [Bacteroidota bacterium]
MKLTILIFLATVLSVSATGYSQYTRLNISLQDASIQELISEIEDQSEFNFFYRDEQLDDNINVNIEADDILISEVLNDVFNGTNVAYSVVDKVIVIRPKENLQNMEITGTVTTSDGVSLPGVTVKIKNTQTGTITGSDGKYTIDVSEANAVLVFSFIGYDTQEVMVGNSTTIDVTLVEGTTKLDEIVFIGYGNVRKQDLTGSVAIIAEEDFNLGGAISNPEQLIQGRAAGVQISTTSAQPGAVPLIRIRGNNSLQGSNQPLFVVDGLPMEALDNMIDVNDIKTMEILKDASAAAIYGTRGANGVVLITTKRGVEGQTKINFSYEHSMDYVANTDAYDFLNAQEYVQVRNDEAIRTGAPVPFTPTMISTIDKYGEGTEWMQEIFQPGDVDKYSLSLTSGTKDTRVYFSTNYMDWKGVVPNTNFEKFTGRLNLDQNMFDDRLKIGMSSTISNTSQNILGFRGSNFQSNIMRNILKNSNPITPTNLDDWTEADRDIVFGAGTRPTNPIEIIDKDKLLLTNLAIISNLSAEFKITEDLSFITQVGINVRNIKQRHFLPIVEGLVATDITQGSAHLGHSNFVETNIENMLRYSKVFAEKHSIEALAVYSNQSYTGEGFTAAAENFTSENLEWNNLGAGATILTPSSYIQESKLVSFTGRINYGYDNRYNLSATMRRDGSSKFGDNHKWGNFPSFAGAWKIHNESFFDVNWVSNLKLRAGWGITGSDRFAIGARQAKYDPGAATTLDSDMVRMGVIAANLGNEDLQWEETRATNLGFELGLFNERIMLEVDLYKKLTEKLLWNMSIPPSLGFSSILANVGTMENKGVEILLSTENVSTENFKWITDLTFAYNENEIKELILPEGVEFVDGPTVGHHIQVSALMQGYPGSTFFGYKYRGILQEGEVDALQPDAVPGDALYKDTDGNGVVNADDRDVLGCGIPKYTFGLNNRFTYRNWELSFFLQGVADVDVLNLNNVVGYDFGTLTTALTDRWTSDNPDGTLPLNGWGRTYYTNDYNLEKGDYISLKTLKLAYSLPAKKLGLSWLDNLTLSFSTNNLLVLTKYSGFYPEVNSTNWGPVSGRPPSDIVQISGVDSYAYPYQKSYIFGISFGF